MATSTIKQQNATVIKSFKDVSISTSSLTWGSSHGVYQANAHWPTLFNRPSLLFAHVVAYAGTPMYTMVDGSNIVLIAPEQPDPSETITLRGFFSVTV